MKTHRIGLVRVLEKCTQLATALVRSCATGYSDWELTIMLFGLRNQSSWPVNSLLKNLQRHM